MLKLLLKKVVVFVITLQAKLVLAKYKPRIIAVTGSVGKTSTKDAIYAVLSDHEFVRKSEKSFNSDIGVPLTILGRPNACNNPLGWLSNIVAGLVLLLTKRHYPKWLVLEVGADRPGDIKKIAHWLTPDVVVVTRLANVPVHVEYFSSAEEVFMEKAELIKAMKSDGSLVLSHDDAHVLSLQNIVRTGVFTFGFSEGSDVRGFKVKVVYHGRKVKRPIGMSFYISHKEKNAEITLQGTVGRQIPYALLAAATVAIRLGITLDEIKKAFAHYQSQVGRMKLIEGIKDTTIIDDSYNSSPVAVREALDVLASLSLKGRKIAVLGDMLELGRFSVQEHKEIGSYAASQTDILITVGPRGRDFALGARQAGMQKENVIECNDAETAARILLECIIPADIVLIKGSQGVRMERTVEALMAQPKEKDKLFVRQEEEWQRR